MFGFIYLMIQEEAGPVAMAKCHDLKSYVMAVREATVTLPIFASECVTHRPRFVGHDVSLK